jgi:hypothetical protein
VTPVADPLLGGLGERGQGAEREARQCRRRGYPSSLCDEGLAQAAGVGRCGIIWNEDGWALSAG